MRRILPMNAAACSARAIKAAMPTATIDALPAPCSSNSTRRIAMTVTCSIALPWARLARRSASSPPSPKITCVRRRFRLVFSASAVTKRRSSATKKGEWVSGPLCIAQDYALPGRNGICADEASSNSEYRQRNRVYGGGIAGVVRVQVVAAVVGWKKPRGAIRVPQQPIQIDHRIEVTAAPDPGIDLLPHRFLFRRVITRPGLRILERRDRRRDDADPAAMRARDECPVTGDQIRGGDGFGSGRDRPRQPEVIHAEGGSTAERQDPIGGGVDVRTAGSPATPAIRATPGSIAAGGTRRCRCSSPAAKRCSSC